jgi:hypothetical protein
VVLLLLPLLLLYEVLVLPLLLLSASKRLSRVLMVPLLLLLPSLLLSGLFCVEGGPKGRMTTGRGPLGGPTLVSRQQQQQL